MMFSLDNLCRICERQTNLIDISLNPNYIENYLMCGNVSYDIDDGLPQFFCRFCITQLLHAVKFKQKCEETYNKLTNLLQIKKEADTLEFNEIKMDDFDDNNSIISVTETKPFEMEFNANYNYTITEEVYLDNHYSGDFRNIMEYENFNKINEKTYETKRKVQLICDICCKTETENIFESIENLEAHMNKFHRMATNLRQCEECGNDSKWLTFDQLRVHNNTTIHTKPTFMRTNEKPYKCEYCNKYFSRRSNLSRHKKSMHTADKSFKCQYCDKGFYQKINLVQHTKTHTGENLYKCEYCEKQFLRKSNLNSHKRYIHTGEKPYDCEYCNKCFSEKSKLNIHIRTHTGEKPYKCEYCNKCFSLQHHLKIHKTVHTSEKPYKCGNCDKCFSKEKSLNTHTRIHTR